MSTRVSRTVAQVHRRDRTRRRTAYLTVAVGCLGLVSAAARPLRAHLADLFVLVPTPIPQVAAVALVYVSLALLFSARGLRRGSRLAWMVVSGLLAVSAVLHLMKGIDVAQAVVAAGAATWLLAQHRAFPCLPSRSTVIRAVVVAAGGTVSILAVSILVVAQAGGFRAADIDETTDVLADRLGGDHLLPVDIAGRFAHAAFLAILVGCAGLLLWLLLSPRVLPPLTGDRHRRARERARDVVARHGGGTLDYFALRDDKQWFFVGQSLVAYTVRAGVCLVAPDPIGPPAEREQTWVEFMVYAERSGWTVTILGAAAAWVPIYEATGLNAICMGEEAIVDSASFTLEGRAARSLRQAHARVGRAGYTATFHDPATADPVARAGLGLLVAQSRRGDAERGFAMTLSRLFDPADTGLMVSVARDDTGTPQAFAQWVPAAGINGWSLDVMRRNTQEDLPNGIMDFLIIETLRHVRNQGGGGVSLNFAMFRSVLTNEDDRRWVRTLRAVLEKASGRESFESLGRFNQKFMPNWVPRYLVVGPVDTWARQGVVWADVEGVTEIPVLGRLIGKRAAP